MGSTDFIAGSIAGFAGLLVSQPFDNVKVLQQTAKRRQSAFSCGYRVVREHGAKGLYRGLGPPLASTPFINAITFAVYAKASSVQRSSRGSTLSSFTQSALAGSAAGACEAVVRIPVECVKIKMQTQQPMRVPMSLNMGGGAVLSPTLPYRSSLGCLVSILQTQGMKGLWVGSTATFLREVPSFGLYFGFYEAARAKLQAAKFGEGLSATLAGGSAGCASWALVFPFDTVKSSQQAMQDCRHPQAVSMVKKAQALYQEAGVRRFYRGLSVAMVRAFSVNACIFPVYELTTKLLQQA